MSETVAEEPMLIDAVPLKAPVGERLALSAVIETPEIVLVPVVAKFREPVVRPDAFVRFPLTLNRVLSRVTEPDPVIVQF